MTIQTASGASVGRSGSRVMRWLITVPLVLVAFFALLATGGWFLAAWQAEKVLDRWAQREAERGRVWICPDRRVSGFPFRFIATCNEPRYSSNQFGRESFGRVKRMQAEMHIFRPGVLDLAAEGPFVFGPEPGTEAQLSWGEARAQLRAERAGPREAHVVLSHAVLAFAREDGALGEARAQRVTFDATPSKTEPAGMRAALRVEALVAPQLDRLTGNSDAVSVAADLLAENLVLEWGGTLVSRAERWRAAGGVLRVQDVTVSKGAAQLALRGDLTIDATRRLEGEINGSAVGLGPLLQRFGLQPGGERGGRLGGFLGQVLGGAHAAKLPISLRFQNGKAHFGPFPLFPLRPLYGVDQPT